MDNEKMIDMMKTVYGDDVIDNFYPWVEANRDLFE